MCASRSATASSPSPSPSPSGEELFLVELDPGTRVHSAGPTFDCAVYGTHTLYAASRDPRPEATWASTRRQQLETLAASASFGTMAASAAAAAAAAAASPRSATAPLRDDPLANQAALGSVQFSLPSADVVRRTSHVEVSQRQIYAPGREVVAHGPLDKRMGVSDKSDHCGTCGLKLSECVGHYGHLELALPVFHIGYLNHVVHVLQGICKSCSAVLLDEDAKRAMRLRMRARRAREDKTGTHSLMKQLVEICKRQSVCPHCGALNGTVKKASGPREHASFPGSGSGGGASSYYAMARKMHGPRLVHECGGKGGLNKRQQGALTAQMCERVTMAALATGGTMDAVPALSEGAAKEVGGARLHEELTPYRVLRLLRDIPDEDVELFDMNKTHGKPENLLITALPVPPVCIRPSVCSDPSQGSTEDDLTVQVSEIAGVNLYLTEQIAKGAEYSKFIETWDHLQVVVARYINAELPGLPPSMYNKPQIGLAQRLKGKQGRFRGNLSGKRVDFSSRTVISPDPNLTLEQVGVPVRVAKTLTYPERVTPYNIQRLRVAVARGPELHPGANFVSFPDGNKRFLKYGNKEDVARELAVGCVVERHLIDGDIVLFNRQPSLHRLSIMGHRVKVVPGRTFRFNECVCTPYNADFDGDEMNLHVPQTEEARAEALELMSVVRNLNTPRNGEPLIACTQDFITAVYLLTHKDVFYDRAMASQCVSWAVDATGRPPRLPPPAIVRPRRYWTGKQIFSVILAARVSPSAPSPRAAAPLDRLSTDCVEKGYSRDGAMCPNDGFVMIRRAELICGQVGKRTVGDGTKSSVLYVIAREIGPEAAASCMSRLAKFSARWLSDYGFSFGVGDVRPTERLESGKAALLAKGYDAVNDMIARLHAGKLTLRPGCTPEETLEHNVNKELSDVREHAGKLCLRQLDRENAPMKMAMSGAKGSTINISQMIACVGQQTVSGSRVPAGFHQRTLPHFERGDKTPAARGFVANSFYSGMTATEFFFHTMAGREGLVDTAVKTAETGYMQRRLMKALEDLRVEYDRSVRGSDGSVVQFRYGGDDLDPLDMEGDEGVPLDYKRMLNSVRWRLPRTPHGRPRVSTPPTTGAAVAGAGDDADADAHCRILRADEVHECASRFVRSPAGRSLTSAQGTLRAGFAEFLDSLAPGQPRAGDAGVTRAQLRALLEDAAAKLHRAQIDAGTAVGAIAAQSIGEPSTQMTLKTFHFAGVASMNITQGVPRIKELINAAKTISTPLITAEFAVPPGADPLEHARRVRGRVERTTLDTIASSMHWCWKRDGAYFELVLDDEYLRRQHLTELDRSVVKKRLTTDAKLKLNGSVTLVRDKLGRQKLRVRPQFASIVDNVMKSARGSGAGARRHLARKRASGAYRAGAGDADRVAGNDESGDDNGYDDDDEDEDEEDEDADGAGAREKVANAINDEIARLKQAIPEVVVGGIASAKRAVINQRAAGTYNLLVESDDLRAVLTTEGMDFRAVTCNHVMAVEEVLGIEAARHTIIDEIKVTMGSHGITVDGRHVELLADVMTSKGEVLGITRFGISKMRNSTLMLASFEKTVDNLFDAAVHGRRDGVAGVSECIIMGKPMPLGTGMFSLAYRGHVGAAGGAHEPAHAADAGHRERCAASELRTARELVERYRRRQRSQRSDARVLDGVHSRELYAVLRGAEPEGLSRVGLARTPGVSALDGLDERITEQLLWHRLGERARAPQAAAVAAATAAVAAGTRRLG